MRGFRKVLRDSLPEIIGGWVVAIIGALVIPAELQTQARIQNALTISVVGVPLIGILYLIAGSGESASALPIPVTPGGSLGTTSAARATIGRTHHIPSGPVIIGSRLHVREAPPRRAFVGEFEVCEHPVTVSQFAAFVKAEGYNEQVWWSADGWTWRHGGSNRWGRPDPSKPHDWVNQSVRGADPVVGVTWFEVEAYCTWLGNQLNRLIRLPSEEEWERAARGEDARLWPWGNTFSRSLANTYERGLGGVVMAGGVVGDRSPFGLVDMAGNVQDWTSSSYTPLEGEALPPGPLRVARGGSWNDTAFGSRTSVRHVYPPGYFFPFLGFRIVVERL